MDLRNSSKIASSDRSRIDMRGAWMMPLLGVSLFLAGSVPSANAQSWTQVSTPNVGTCYYPAGATTDGCVMGNSIEPSSQPNPTSSSNQGSINNPGLAARG